MNTRKQVLVMSGLLMMMLIITGVYAAWYPSRAENSAEEFDEKRVDRASLIFARNCRLCHGDIAEGGAAGARLPAAPALDRPDLQAFKDSTQTVGQPVTASATSMSVSAATGAAGSIIVDGSTILVDQERMLVTGVAGTTLEVERGEGHTEAAPHAAATPVYVFDAKVFADASPASLRRTIINTITCGRVGTAMPAWGQAQGGSLSDEQIIQLTTLIMGDRWDVVKAEVDKEDRIAATLLTPIGADTINVQVSDVSVFNEKEAIRIGDERLRVVAVTKLPRDAAGNLPKDRSGIIELQRGVLKTTPLDHAIDETLYRFPETPEPSINQSSCGQTAKAPAPTGTPATIEPFEGQTAQLIAQNITFDVREIRVRTGGQVRLRLDNRDVGVQHNVGVYKSATDPAPAADGSVGLIFAGAGIDDTVFNVPAAGSYVFRCDVHPTTMTGSFIVQ